MRVVEDHDRGRRELRDFGQQRGQRIEFAVGLQSCSASRPARRNRGRWRARSANNSRSTKRARSSCASSDRPGDEGAPLQPVAPPLREQRRLAEALRRRDDDRGAVVDLGPAVLEALPDGSGPARPRRRRLQLELKVSHRPGAACPARSARLAPRLCGAAKHSASTRRDGGTAHPPHSGGSGRPRWRLLSAALGGCLAPPDTGHHDGDEARRRRHALHCGRQPAVAAARAVCGTRVRQAAVGRPGARRGDPGPARAAGHRTAAAPNLRLHDDLHRAGPLEVPRARLGRRAGQPGDRARIRLPHAADPGRRHRRRRSCSC